MNCSTPYIVERWIIFLSSNEDIQVHQLPQHGNQHKDLQNSSQLLSHHICQKIHIFLSVVLFHPFLHIWIAGCNCEIRTVKSRVSKNLILKWVYEGCKICHWYLFFSIPYPFPVSYPYLYEWGPSWPCIWNDNLSSFW